ncbi:MAG: tetraacyldisaccharide 4'-kinase [Campylobacterota bacterium]|nr:tetraacyldisaccharide 4'-kinase [Campylobacterota bacterium]
MKHFFETMYFSPKGYHYSLMVILFPLSLLYGIVMLARRMVRSPKAFDLPIISVGNLMVGGSGKTPFVIALASVLEGVTVISRGYGRLSRGMIEVSHHGKILVDVEQSGDEPMLMARSLPKCSVIVSEERVQAIALAKERGAKVIILDDGFNRVEIKKFEILLEPEKIKNYLPFPSGGFREFWFIKSLADMVLKEGIDFTREVEIVNPTERMVLLTAISNPQRLDKFLPHNLLAKKYLEDHAYFDAPMLKGYMDEYQASSLLCTSKDKVKLNHLDITLSEMKLKLVLDNDIMTKIDLYIKGYKFEREDRSR